MAAVEGETHVAASAANAVPTADLMKQVERGGGLRLVSSPFEQPKPSGWTRFVCFSDTHGLHNEIPNSNLVEADVLLHAGDFSNTGEIEQVHSFAAWLDTYPAEHKVVIAGNHETTFHPSFYKNKWKKFHRAPYDCEETRQTLIDYGCCTYLQDEDVEVMGYRIYGSPWQPEFCDWAFNLPRGPACQRVWERIPWDIDILMTHGPPFGKGDLCDHGARVGCEDLMREIRSRAVPVHVSGHIHEGYGAESDGTTVFINASTCTSRYQPTNLPIVFDLPPAEKLRENFPRPSNPSESIDEGGASTLQEASA
eukprot:TRINITY_DN45866_c0_g1_i1.p1 TRINITY_DN45866_c0_g1~~TRINITY_DN45866_c0_g1_i1.p1  ORF type:complete len:309 (-),score=36.13 TRINITY_DN45866_c0_g1_i1:145-1071(-)